MLPPHGFSFGRYEKLFNDVDTAWEQYIRKAPNAPGAVQEMLTKPVMHEEFKVYKVAEEDRERVLKRSLLILHHALGDYILGKLLRFQHLETIASVFQLAIALPPEGHALRTANLQTTVLYQAIERLCWEAGPGDPGKALFYLLNEIPLPYKTHQLFLDNLVPQFKERRVSRH